MATPPAAEVVVWAAADPVAAEARPKAAPPMIPRREIDPLSLPCMPLTFHLMNESG
jgi:hypothetical protein